MSRLTNRKALIIGAVCIIVLAMLLLWGCDVPGTPRPLVGVDDEPVVEEPEEPEPPEDAGDTNEQPDYLTQVTTHQDTLFIRSAASVGVGETRDVEGRIASTGERTFNVVVGVESPICDLERFEIVGIVDNGTAAMGALALAGPFTEWMADACTVLGWRVPFGPGGGEYEFAVRIRGLDAGEAEFRTQFEVAGFDGQSFRWAAFTGIEVLE